MRKTETTSSMRSTRRSTAANRFFSYYQYSGRKQQKLKNSGAEYVCSPWMLVWNGDYYYLLSHTDRHGVTPFRVDRIALPPHILEEDAETFPVDGKTFQASVPVTANKLFFGWVFGFDEKVGITAPAKVKREYEKMLQRAVENN